MGNEGSVSHRFLMNSIQPQFHELHKQEFNAVENSYQYYHCYTSGFNGYQHNTGKNVLQQTSAGAIMLTDIVFWCLLLPFMLGESFQLTLVSISAFPQMHKVDHF